MRTPSPVHGILLQYIPAIDLNRFATIAVHSPTLDFGQIAKVGEGAIRLVDHLSESSMINHDLRLENILITDQRESRLPTCPSVMLFP